MTILRLAEKEITESLTILIFGASKSGKTHLVGTLGSRMVYVYFREADGSKTIQNKDFFPNLNPLMIEVEPGNEGFDKMCDDIDFVFKNHLDDFDFLVVDEMTAAQRSEMKKALELNTEDKRSKSKARADKRRGIILPTKADFGTTMGITDWFFATYIDICKEHNKHFIACAHEGLLYIPGAKPNDEDILTRIRPAFIGKKAPDDLIAYFDAVFYVEQVGGNTYRMKTKGDDVLVAGHRFGNKLERIIKDPSLPSIIKKIAKGAGKP